MHRVRPIITTILFSLLAAFAAAQTSEDSGTTAWEWRFIAGGATVGRGATDGRGIYYFAAEDRFLYAISRNGTMLWRTDLGRRPSGIMSIGFDGTVFVGLDNGDFLALNKDGRLLFEIDTPVGTLLDPVLLDTGVIILARSTGTLDAYTHMGRRIWSVDLQAELVASPIAAHDGKIYVGTADGYLVQVSLQGEIGRRWYLADIPSTLASTSSGILSGSRSGSVIFSTWDEGPLWRSETGARVTGVIASDDDDVYVLSADGSLVRILDGGAIAWRAHPSPSQIVSAIAGDGVTVTIGSGETTRLLREGTPDWRVPMSEAPLQAVVASYGSLIVPTDLWVTYAYDIEIPVAQAWPYRRGDDRARGVSPGVSIGRVSQGEYAASIEYLYLSEYLLSPYEQDQIHAMNQIADKIDEDPNLAGSYHYILRLCETVAGAPYFGPLAVEPRPQVSRRVREDAIDILGRIGDLQSAALLARVLHKETDTSLQVVELEALANLGTILDGGLMTRIKDMIDRNSVTRPSDQLAYGVLSLIQSVHRYEGGFLTQDVADIISRVIGADYGQSVKQYALTTLRVLTGRE